MKRGMFDRLKSDMNKGGFNAKSVVALLIFGAIIIVFVLFGAAAQVNATLISAADLRQEAQRLEQMYAPMFGGQMGSDTQRQFVRQQALENLISTELMAQGANKIGILATDEEVKNVIVREIPAFQDNGKFQRERYLGILQANRWTPGEFETRIRKERQTQRLRRMFEIVASPTAQELEKNKEMRERKRNVDFVRIEKSVVVSKMPLSEADIQARLANEDFAKKVQSEFEVNKDQYGTEEQVKAQHILIKTNPDKPADDKLALDKIMQIAKRAGKEDFSKLAAEVSEDLGSKKSGGDLGYFGKGKMVPAFEKAAFSQKVGTISEPIKSDFGYHLIKVTDRKAAMEPKVEVARMTIGRRLIAAERYDEEVKKIEEALAKGETATVEKFVKDLGLSWDETGYFEIGLEAAPKLTSPVATSLAMEVSQAQPWPKKLARDGGALYLVKWKGDKREPLPAGEKVAENLERERSFDLMNSWLETVKKDSTIERNQTRLNSL
jgi:peptidyl-prolyl cis-trans isomerase D